MIEGELTIRCTCSMRYVCGQPVGYDRDQGCVMHSNEPWAKAEREAFFAAADAMAEAGKRAKGAEAAECAQDAREHAETLFQIISALGWTSETATPDDRDTIVAAVRELRGRADKLAREHRELLGMVERRGRKAHHWHRYTPTREPVFGDVVRLVGCESDHIGVVVCWTVGGASVVWRGCGLTAVGAYSAGSLEWRSPSPQGSTTNEHGTGEPT